MGAALLLQTLAAPLGAALLSWRWPRRGYLWGALALWLVGCLLGGVYGVPVKAWQWLPLALLVPAMQSDPDLRCAVGRTGRAFFDTRPMDWMRNLWR